MLKQYALVGLWWNVTIDIYHIGNETIILWSEGEAELDALMVSVGAKATVDNLEDQ